MTTFKFIGSFKTRLIAAVCDRCHTEWQTQSPWAVFRHCGQVERVPESVQAKFLAWRPATLKITEEDIRKGAARGIGGNEFQGEHEYERAIPPEV